MKDIKTTGSSKRGRPAMTPEAREEQLIALAMDAAEEKLRNKTASSQLIVEFVKRGSTKERLEREILEKQKDLITAKTKGLEAVGKSKEFYSEVIDAIKGYAGAED